MSTLATTNGKRAESVPTPVEEIVLSFDVEEHDRIEAAADLSITDRQKLHYLHRVEPPTRWILDQLAEHDIRATFFIVGQTAKSHAKLVYDIGQAGHEVAAHSWDHRRVHRFTPESFREDLRKCKDALEQASGQPVVGFRAPTFSIMRETGWAIDALAEAGFEYDSSIYPIRHDRYGVPDAPFVPFVVRGEIHEMIELPPATLQVRGAKLPVGGGGYFRMFPLNWMKRALRQGHMGKTATWYFHPWEFDAHQNRLALRPISRFRTYAGIHRSRPRLRQLLSQYHYRRAVDAADELKNRLATLPRYSLVE